MDKIDEIKSNTNKPQRIVIAVTVPILSLIVGYGLLSMLLDSFSYEMFSSRSVTPFELNHTWWLWVIILLAISTFEFLWFKDEVPVAPLNVNRINSMMSADGPNLKAEKITSIQLSEMQQLFLKVKEYPYNWGLQHELLSSLNIPFALSFWGNYKITYQGKLIHVKAESLPQWIINNLSNHPEFKDI